MAEVTTKSTGVTFVLELSEAEAQYVAEALRRSTPRLEMAHGFDPVWDALTEAMRIEGVRQDEGAVISVSTYGLED